MTIEELYFIAKKDHKEKLPMKIVGSEVEYGFEPTHYKITNDNVEIW